MEKDRKGAQAKGDAKKAAGKMTGEANLEVRKAKPTKQQQAAEHRRG
jgi:uncharacterized protein YjbJ (UPF0337 family)